tara:strand:- start:2903 stop:3049 length:147 start_codon:yes stop_codon:yes gene_type:complete
MPKKNKSKPMPSLIEEDIIKHKETRKNIKVKIFEQPKPKPPPKKKSKY